MIVGATTTRFSSVAVSRACDSAYNTKARQDRISSKVSSTAFIPAGLYYFGVDVRQKGVYGNRVCVHNALRHPHPANIGPKSQRNPQEYLRLNSALRVESKQAVNPVSVTGKAEDQKVFGDPLKLVA